MTWVPDLHRIGAAWKAARISFSFAARRVRRGMEAWAAEAWDGNERAGRIRGTLGYYPTVKKS